MSKTIIGEAFKIHREIGCGLLENAYERVLEMALRDQGLHVKRQVPYNIVYNGFEIGPAYRADLVIEGRLIIEIKSVEFLHQVAYKQLLTYLRLSNITLGLIINFAEPDLRDGIKRVVNGYLE